MKNIKILLDAAHGTNIPGKRSPDSSHIEYIWSRKMIKQIEVMLHTAGYEVVNLIPEDIDPKDHLKRIDINTTQPRTLLISFHNILFPLFLLYIYKDFYKILIFYSSSKILYFK